MTSGLLLGRRRWPTGGVGAGGGAGQGLLGGVGERDARVQGCEGGGSGLGVRAGGQSGYGSSARLKWLSQYWDYNQEYFDPL